MANEYLSLVEGDVAAPARNPYMDLIQSETQAKETQFRAATSLAIDTNPDKVATEKKMAGYLGTVPAVVQTLPQDAERAAKLKQIDDNTANAPVLRLKYGDVAFANMAHDDSSTLSSIESLFGSLASVGKYIVSAPGQEQGLLRDIGATGFQSMRMIAGLNRAAVEGLAIPEDAINNLTGAGPGPLRRNADALGQSASYFGQRAKEVGSQWDPNSTMQQIFGGGAASGVQSAIQSLGTGVAASYLLGPEVGIPVTLAALAAGQGGESFQKAREKGVGYLKSLMYGAEDATAEFVTEKYLGVGGFLKNVMAGASAKKLVAYELFKEVPGEMGATLWQNFNEWANINPEKSIGEFLNEQPVAMAQTVVATLVGGGAQIGAVKALEKSMGSMVEHEQKTQDAETQRTMLDQLNTLAEQSKLKARDQETFQQFVEATTDGTPAQDLYIAANTLMQSGVAEQVAQALPSVREQLPDALASNGYVRIPTAEYAAMVSGTELNQSLIDHVKTDPNGYTFAESKEYQGSFNQEMQTQMERLLTDKQADETFKASRDVVRDEFLNQLNEAKRFTTEANQAYATMLANFYAVTAAKLNMTPQALVERYKLRAQAEAVTGAAEQYDQAGQLKTETPEFKAWFGDSKVIGAEGKPLVVFHQTNDQAEARIIEEGFKADHPRARASDEQVPDGFFFKPDERDIRVGSSDKSKIKQIPVFISLKNPFVVRNRSQISELLNDAEYTKLAEEVRKLDKDLAAEFDANFNDESISNDTAAWDVFSTNWENRVNTDLPAAAAKARQRLTAVLRERGFDGMVIENDQGSAGRSTKTYIALDPTQVKSIDNRGAFNPTDPNIYNQFAGKNAATADAYALKTAEDRLANGEPAERVRRETGWFQGVDGMWRFEIADDEAKFNSKGIVTPEGIADDVRANVTIGVDDTPMSPATMAVVLKSQPDWKPLTTATYKQGTPEQLKAFGHTEADAIKNLITHLVTRMNKGSFDISKVKANDEVRLSAVLDHPKLFAAYPDLANIPVTFVDGVDYRGAYYPTSDKIRIATSGDVQQMLSTLLHEIQHAIQHREGFATGGNTDSDFTRAIRNALDLMEKQARESVEQWKWSNKSKMDAAEQASAVARYGLMYESAQRLIDYSNRDKPSGMLRLIRNEMQWIYSEDFRTNDEAKELQRAFYGIPKSHKMRERNAYLSDMAFRASRMLQDHIPAELRDEFKNDKRTLKGMLNALQRESDRKRKELTPLRDLETTVRRASGVRSAHRYSTPFDIYQALAGEVEARNTQARQAMTEGERRDQSPSNTADVPAERTVVMFGGLDIQAPMAAFPQDGGATMNQGQRGQIAFGQDITQIPSVITLFKGADLSTFLHESGHFFLEVQMDMAARIEGEAAAFGDDTNSEGERQILADTQKLLDWFGVQSIQEWYGLSAEERRSYHEKFARGFEAYAFEGNAPTLELQAIFQRFRAWLVNIYRELKNLNVELTDDVRGVMDRMLATTEQIQAAETARNMGPLFTPENAKDLIDDWQAYHNLANASTAEAIDELQAKALTDMQWMSNARTRILRQLQKQHDALRAEVTIESRREIMSQPVYRAWQFLTAKMSKEDKEAVTPEAPRKSVDGPVDESVDSLFTAIAKLGGLDRDQVRGQWGLFKDERSPMPLFGKPVVRKTDGLGIDAMAERLAEYGYLPVDENGKHDLADFEAAFDAEYRGDTQYSVAHNYANAQGEQRAGEWADLENLGAGRFDLVALKEMGLPSEIIEHIVNLKMTAKDGIAPDLVAESFGFTSGDELVRTLAIAEDPKVAIKQLTDQKMLERHGDLASPEAIAAEADKAVHNEMRAKMLHAEARALEKAMAVQEATGKTNKKGQATSYAVLPKAAREFAERMVARLKVRDIRPSQYAAAEAKAAREAERAFGKGDIEGAAEQKRNQIINNYATRAAYNAQEEVRKAVTYLRKFDKKSKGLDADYYDQIVQMLERFDLVPSTSLKTIDRRTSLANWLKAQEEAGFVPEMSAELEAEAYRKSYKDMTVEELRGLRDTVKQIEHLGRLKQTLLTAKDQRDFDTVREEMVNSIIANGQGRIAENRTPNTVLGEKLVSLKNFWASHIKAATWARIMDGGKDGGPVWEYLIRSANAAGDKEVGLREEATKELSALVAPVLAEGKMGGKGTFFPSVGRSFNKEARLAIALNLGNASNMQRLLGGEGWTLGQVKPILDTLTTADWRFVQSVWDYFESYRPEIGAKQRRVYGTEPAWIDAQPLSVQTADGDTLSLRGGYYPVKYDPRSSERAESHMEAETAKRMMQGAYTSATTRRSFTKGRVEEVNGRPLLYSLDGIYNGVNEVIHDLSWHEWLIDANRLLKNPKIAEAMRETYGAEVHNQFKNWVKDIAEGDRGAQNAGEKSLAWIRQGVSISGLGINVMSALLQPFGITQSMVRIGPKWVGKGIAKTIADPVGTNAEIAEMSEFMRTRGLTRMRELAELRNQVKGQTQTRANIDAAAYALMLRAQQLVDIPTWWGAYEKATAEGNGEERAVALADQAVIDAQGSGTTKDLAAIERGGPALKLFTVFYSFMNTSLNLGVGQTMTAESKAKLAADYMLIYVVPVVLIALMKSAFTPGDSGDWEDPEKIALKLLKEEVGYMMGLFFGVRELQGIVDAFQGKPQGEYSGPAGTRMLSDTLKLAKQVGQGEMDDGLRKATINVAGELLRLPSAQINRSITGAKALADGKTKNPAALVFGYEEPH